MNIEKQLEKEFLKDIKETNFGISNLETVTSTDPNDTQIDASKSAAIDGNLSKNNVDILFHPKNGETKNAKLDGNLSKNDVDVEIQPKTNGNNVNISFCSVSLSCSCSIM
jgi:hypothetical protein